MPPPTSRPGFIDFARELKKLAANEGPCAIDFIIEPDGQARLTFRKLSRTTT